MKQIRNGYELRANNRIQNAQRLKAEKKKTIESEKNQRIVCCVCEQSWEFLRSVRSFVFFLCAAFRSLRNYMQQTE